MHTHPPKPDGVVGLYGDQIRETAEKKLQQLPGQQGGLFEANPILISSLISSVSAQLYDRLYHDSDDQFSQQEFIEEAIEQSFAGKDAAVKTTYGTLSLNKHMSKALLVGVDTTKVFPLYADPPPISLTKQRKRLKNRINMINNHIVGYTPKKTPAPHVISATIEQQQALLDYAQSFLAQRGIALNDKQACSKQRGRILGAYFLQHNVSCHNRTDFIKFTYCLAEHLSLDEETRYSLISAVSTKRTLLYKSCFVEPDYQNFTYEELNELEEEINWRYGAWTSDPKGYVHDRYTLLRKIMSEGESMQSVHKKMFGDNEYPGEAVEDKPSNSGTQLTFKAMYPHFPDGSYDAERRKKRLSYEDALKQVLKPHKQSYEKGILIKLFNKYNYYHKWIAPLPVEYQKQKLEHYKRLLLSKMKTPQINTQQELFSTLESQQYPTKLINLLSVRIKFDHP